MTRDTAEEPRWQEADSEEFIDSGRYFVPQRELQIDTVCRLIPPPAAGAHLVDLCCGEGLLCQALLERFPQARVYGFDGSQRMLERSRQRLADFGDRYDTRQFDLADSAWREFDEAVHAFVSSLAVHHLDGEEKRRLFGDLFSALEPGGALVIADLIEPTSELGREVAADQWDEAVRQRASRLDGDLAAFEHFVEVGWNNYRLTEPDPIDKPSPLAEQLTWMREAGFRGVDAHWMLAGHVIFSGYKPPP